MVVDFGFEYGEVVYYVSFLPMSYTYQVEQGKIIGFSCRQYKGKPDLRVNFKQHNGVPIDEVFRTEPEAIAKGVELIAELKKQLEG